VLALSNREWVSFSPHYEDLEDFMNFRLTYAGRIPTNAGAREKQEMRRYFHKQLKNLWKGHPLLKQWSGAESASPHNSILDQIRGQFKFFGYEFVPLVSKNMMLIVSLDILLLRAGPPGFIIKAGDIDNKIKTVIDSLQLPQQLSETGGLVPDSDETPFFSLMQNDELVGNLSVTTDMLLEPTDPKVIFQDRHDARLVIDVTIKNQYGAPFAPAIFI